MTASPASSPGQYFDAETGLHQNFFRDYDPRTGRYIEPDPIGLAGGMNLYPYVENRPTVRIDLGGLSSLLYDSSSNKIWVFDRQMRLVGVGPASNNAQRASKGPWPAGTFPYEGYVPHPEDDSSGRFGPYGNYLFTVPRREFMGVHAGRKDSCDRADRCGYEYATEGCIRTTDEIMNLIRQLHTSGDSLEWLSVIYRD